MSDIRTKIQNELLLLGKGLENTHLSELHVHRYQDKRVIKNEILNFDYSKQRLDDGVVDYLLHIPDAINLKDSLQDLFNGNVLNPSEGRTVSHTIYRDKNSRDKFKLIFSERERIKSFLEGKNILKTTKNVICLSIGGSRLGPELLNEFQSLDEPVNIYFCSSLDLLELSDVLRKCNQSETIIFASSKSFETPEILKNLEHVKSWYSLQPKIDFYDHLYGISANTSAMTAYGIKQINQFQILDSLGGRFSIWSSISLPAFINSNYSSYLDLLEGAYLADEHTSKSSWESNIPVMMALLSVWNASSLNINNHGIFTYNFRLRSLTKYISQLSMESNGKSINFESKESPFCTSPLIWGGYGIESQHSTFQWLMQGKTDSSCDFIGLNDGKEENMDSYEMLLSQVLAMTYGKEDKESPFKTIKGNNPCSILQLKSIDLKSLGFLLALYEHKVFIEASILGINPFDQWGVQLGKKLALESKNNKEIFKDHFSRSIHPKS
tara:strand:+ start:6952 stop:8436 length:1485 start_codon:yes stop_codon:yes gene_type:complete